MAGVGWLAGLCIIIGALGWPTDLRIIIGALGWPTGLCIAGALHFGPSQAARRNAAPSCADAFSDGFPGADIAPAV